MLNVSEYMYKELWLFEIKGTQNVWVFKIVGTQNCGYLVSGYTILVWVHKILSLYLLKFVGIRNLWVHVLKI